VPEYLPVCRTRSYGETGAEEESKSSTDRDVRLLRKRIVVDGRLVQRRVEQVVAGSDNHTDGEGQ
jgi:hypothetical protein